MSKQIKRFVLVGGGSGGHLTPLVAIAEALKAIEPDCIICHVGQRGEDLSEVTRHPSIDESYEIRAGKFRRYHGESAFRQLVDIKTVLLNSRDIFRFIGGTFESYFLLRRLKPASVFLKGGFVSVPVGYAARALKIPYVTHDSDAIPGLANRMTASRAVYNLTALPTVNYPYEPQKALQVGIPLQKEFRKVSNNDKQHARKSLSIPADAQVLLGVGGGLGSKKINDAIVSCANELMQAYPQLIIVHITGKSLYDQTKKSYVLALSEDQLTSVKVIDFSTTLYRLSAAADIIITRGGATNIAEFAAQAKPCIVVPAPHLTGGQQLHNAQILEDAEAALIVQERDLDGLVVAIRALLDDSHERVRMSESLHKLAVSAADDKIARLLIDIQKERSV
jgi:UDP-N-acetylglucosamine--N-acetylmuramyl-(pentapeptide) pyrophosphoryl-undecaprenol N-acetylglucosamine transferase